MRPPIVASRPPLSATWPPNTGPTPPRGSHPVRAGRPAPPPPPGRRRATSRFDVVRWRFTFSHHAADRAAHRNASTLCALTTGLNHGRRYTVTLEPYAPGDWPHELVRGLLDRIAGFGLGIRGVTADGGFASGDTRFLLRERKLAYALPLQRKGSSRGAIYLSLVRIYYIHNSVVA